MARTMNVTCDVCGRAKGETNHWFIAFTRPDSPGIAFAPADYGTAVLPEGDMVAQVEDICGLQCLHVRLSKWIPFKTTEAA